MPGSRWVSAGTFNDARADHTATLLPSGDVLLAGGGASLQMPASTPIYDHNSGLWSFWGTLANPRIWHTSTLLTNGDVLIAGGYGGPGPAFLASSELYWPFKFPWQFGASRVLTGGPHDWGAVASSPPTPNPAHSPAGSEAQWGSGLDFGLAEGERVYAMAEGDVYSVGPQQYYAQDARCPDGHLVGAANVVKIRHPGGWETWYLHLQGFADNLPTSVTEATKIHVSSGQWLGRAGTSGACAVHLHVELIKDGQHSGWDQHVIDGWTVHRDCLGSTNGACRETNFDGYMSRGLSPLNEQSLPGMSVGTSTNPSPGSSLDTPAPAGTSILKVPDISIFRLADRIRIDPGAANQEDRTITGFGSLILDSPLQFDHNVGEPVALLSSAPAPSVGGIAEQPAAAALPTTGPGRDISVYAVGAFVALLTAACAMGWRRRRE